MILNVFLKVKWMPQNVIQSYWDQKHQFFLKKQIKTAKELNNLLQIKKEKMNNLNKNASTQLWKTCGKMDSIPKIDKFEIVSNILEGR